MTWWFMLSLGLDLVWSLNPASLTTYSENPQQPGIQGPSEGLPIHLRSSLRPQGRAIVSHSKHTYNSIKHDACEVRGQSGVCMFVWECIEKNGEHLGICVDGFMFGSCCKSPSPGGNKDKPEDKPETATTEAPTGTATTTLSTTRPSLNETTTTPNTPETTNDSTTTLSTTTLKTTTTVTSEESTSQPTTMKPTTSTQEVTTVQGIDDVTTQPTTEGPIALGAHTKVACGMPALRPNTAAEASGRVVNGSDASFGEFPWQVSVREISFFGLRSRHLCGGALLNARWVATAAHCVRDRLKSEIRIRAGDWDVSTSTEPMPYIERDIRRKIVYPEFDLNTYEYDIALLEVKEPIEFDIHISPICLPGNDDDLEGRMATVTGWGKLYHDGPLPNILQKVSLPILSNQRCEEMFLKANRVESIPHYFMCAGYEQGGYDSCQGDSGGPAHVQDSKGRYILAGIISWGIGCAERYMPGVTTRISHFVPWILNYVAQS